jgi:hypothetical protein
VNKDQLVKQLELLHKDLQKCNNRCTKISKACGVEPNELISYAVQQTQDVLDYIESLKEERNG